LDIRNLLSRFTWIGLLLLCFTLISATNHIHAFTSGNDALTAPEVFIADQRTTEGSGEAIGNLNIAPDPSIISDIVFWEVPNVPGRTNLELCTEARNIRDFVQITEVTELSAAYVEQLNDVQNPLLAALYLYLDAKNYSEVTTETRSTATDRKEVNTVRPQSFQSPCAGPYRPCRFEDNTIPMGVLAGGPRAADENQQNLNYQDYDRTGLKENRFSDQSIITGSPDYFYRT